MNSIASLLARATAELADAAPLGANTFELGRAVVLTTTGVDELRGRVGFVDGDWVHWAAEEGSFHATKRDALREI